MDVSKFNEKLNKLDGAWSAWRRLDATATPHTTNDNVKDVLEEVEEKTVKKKCACNDLKGA